MLDKQFGESVKRDKACGGKQYVPLYGSLRASNEAKYCNVDMLILKGNKIKVIIEIEESDIKPVHVFGKFLASASSLCYIYDKKTYGMDKSVSFIQIIDISGLPDKNSKRNQCKNIESSIKKIESKITDYRLIPIRDYEKEKDGILKIISRCLAQ